jgi:hypothetical protein
MAIDNKELREQLVELIKGGSAHVELKSALTDFPTDKRGAKPNGAPYNAWQLLWHMNAALHDLLEFCTSSKYLTPNWPADYWPKENCRHQTKRGSQPSERFTPISQNLKR